MRRAGVFWQGNEKGNEAEVAGWILRSFEVGHDQGLHFKYSEESHIMLDYMAMLLFTFHLGSRRQARIIPFHLPSPTPFPLAKHVRSNPLPRFQSSPRCDDHIDHRGRLCHVDHSMADTRKSPTVD